MHGIRHSRQCQIKKKRSQPVEIHYGFFSLSVFLSFFLSLSSQSARQCGTRTHTHSRTHSVIHTSPTHTHSLCFSSYRHCRFSLSPSLIMSLCSSLPFSIFSFFFLLFAFTVCFALKPPPLSLSFASSLPPPFLVFSLPSFSSSPSSFLCVQSERGHYLSHTGHVRWNGGACRKYSRCKA